ncbi:Copia protein, partial [Gonioctena quinquepunctata]
IDKKKTTEQKKNVVTSIKASSNSEVNKSDKSKMMILCDQHGRGLGKTIGKRVGGTTTVQTIIKPNARYDNVIDNIVNISQDFSLADNIVIIAGYNDFLRGKYPSFKNINDKLKHCTHTNITLVSVPYITEDYITNTNTFIYKFNIRLNDYVTRLNKYAEGKVTFLELNKYSRVILRGGRCAIWAREDLDVERVDIGKYSIEQDFESSTPKGKTKYPSSSELIDCKNTLDIRLVMTRTAEGYNEVFREVKKRYNRLLVDVRKEHYKKHIDESDNKTKCVWQIVSEIKGNPNRKKELKIPGYPNAKNTEDIGALLYIAVNTRPDISVSTSILSRKVSQPTERDWTEVKRILRYLKGIRDMIMQLGKRGISENILHGYAAANWGGDTRDRKSNTGYLFKYSGGLVSWRSKKQDCVSPSSTEVIALSEACQEAMWLKQLLKDFGEVIEIKMFEDNQSCIKMLDSERINDRTKHIDTKYNYAKEMKKKNEIFFEYCSINEMVADLLTKPLEVNKIRKFREMMGLISSD